MAPISLLVAALIAPLALAVPTPGNTYGTGGSAPSGWDASVENFCSSPSPLVLFCCTGTIAGVAGAPTATETGCINAMAGGQVTYLFGYCPYGYDPQCCAATVAAGVDAGCDIPTQQPESKR